MDTHWVKEKIRLRGTAVLGAAQFNAVFPQPRQRELVRSFCQETGTTCEQLSQTEPPLFIFKESHSRLSLPSTAHSADSVSGLGR